MNLFRIILAVLLVNASGIILRYFELDTYFIFLGFRFHLSAVLPFLILLNEKNLHILSVSFRKPVFKRKSIPFLWLIISLIGFFSILFIFEKIKPGDPDYFYEFGISSIFDFPLYLIWNFPQLCFLFLTLTIFSRLNRLSYFNSFIGCISLFAYELVPFNSGLNYSGIISFIFISLTASFFVTKLRNLYWFAFMIFSSVWSIILLFGSKSEIIINIFFAKEYTNWDGFFKVSKEINPYIITAFFLVILIIVFFYAVFFKKNPGNKKENIF